MNPKYLNCSNQETALCGDYAPQETKQGCQYRPTCSIYFERIFGQTKRDLAERIKELQRDRRYNENLTDNS